MTNETPDREGVPAQRVYRQGWQALRGLGLRRRGRDARHARSGKGITFDEQGRARMKVHEWDPTRDLTDDERAAILAEAEQTT